MVLCSLNIRGAFDCDPRTGACSVAQMMTTGDGVSLQASVKVN
jgi:hypothetical protein